MRALLLIIVLSVLSGCFGKTENAYFDEANVSIKNGDVKAAEIILKSALQEYPNSQRLRSQIADLYLQVGRGDFAESHLNKLLESDYQPSETQLRYMNALLLQSKYDDVLLIDVTDNEAAAQLQLFAAVQAGVTNSLRSAAQNLSDPTYQRLANTFLSTLLNDPDNPFNQEAFFNTQLNDINQPHLVLYQATVAERLGDFERGLSLIEQYNRASKVNLYASILKARLLVQADKLDEARKLADTLREVAPNNNYINYLSGYIYFSQGDYAKAHTILTNTSAEGLDQTSFYLISGLAAYSEELYENAYSNLSKLKGRLPPEHPAMKVLMLTELIIGDVSQAADTMLASGPETDTEIGLMFKMLQSDDVDVSTKQQLQTDILKYANKDSRSESLIARHFLANENIEQQLIDNFTQNPARNKNAYSLVYFYLSSNQVYKAINYTEQWASANPTSYLPLNMLGKLHQLNNANEQAKSAYQASLSLAKNIIAHMGLGDLALQAGEIDTARAHYVDAIALEDATPFILSKLLQLAPIAPSAKDITLIADAAKRYPNNYVLALIHARYLSLSSQYANALEILNSMLPPPNTNADIYFAEKERALSRLLKHSELPALYDDWMKHHPDSITMWIKALQFYAKYSPPEAQRLITQFERKPFKDSVKYALLSATYFALQDYDKALASLSNLDQNDVYYQYQSTRIHYQMADYQKAYNSASTLYANNGSDYSALMMAQSLERLGKQTQAKAFLEQNFSANPEHKAANFKLANMLIQDEPERALSMLSELRDRYPRDPFIANNYAWLLLQQNQLSQAREVSEVALALFPTNPYIIHTAAQVSMAQGDYKLASDLLELALKIMPERESFQQTKQELTTLMAN